MLRNREGMALALTLVVTFVLGAIIMAATTIGGTAYTMTRQEDRRAILETAAEAGLEEARAKINGNKNLYPDSLYATIENGVAVYDSAGKPIPGIKRYTYAGPTGITTGQYGVFGSIVSVAEDANGDRVIRRAEVVQESFAKYAYFTDNEGGNIYFGGGDQLFGPVHSNDEIKIHSTGATFHNTVTTAKDVEDAHYATFVIGYKENVPIIPLPQTADLNKLRNYAIAGGTRINANLWGNHYQAATRIEFIAVDLNGDGKTDGSDEGFMRVYQAKNASHLNWVTGHIPNSGMDDSENCGHYHTGGNFVDAQDHPNNGSDDWEDALKSSSRVCYLGGDPQIWDGTFDNDDGKGQWLQWSGSKDPRLNGRADKDYLWPLSRDLNPNFKGVVFVDGKVAISGTLRGRITLATTDNILFVDDLKYVTDPAAHTCADILGLFSGKKVIIADNTLNSPVYVDNSYRTYDDTSDEFLHGVVLALDMFEAENYDSGATNYEDCGTTNWGRGCLFLTGGVIQDERGPVGQSNGTGYLKRYSYDQCAFSDPPPYFPTTGHFARSRVFDIDPVGFTPAGLFASLTPAN